MQKIRVTSDFDDRENTVEVPSIDSRGTRLLYVKGLPTAQVRVVSAAERSMVVNAPFAAAWLGWHRGQVPAYGRSPEDAVRKLAAGEVAR